MTSCCVMLVLISEISSFNIAANERTSGQFFSRQKFQGILTAQTTLAAVLISHNGFYAKLVRKIDLLSSFEGFYKSNRHRCQNRLRYFFRK